MVVWNKLRTGAAIAALIAVAVTSQAGLGADPTCFTARDNARLRFTVIQQAPPPTAGSAGYRYYPLTAAATMQLGALARGGERYRDFYFQWANRSNAPLYSPAGKLLPRKLNLRPWSSAPARERSAFSSVARADACTLAQTAAVLGLDARARSFAREAGVALAPEAGQADAPAAGAADTCVIAASRLPGGDAGVMLDYEPQDGRSGAQTLAFLTAFAGLVHGAGKKAALLVDPLDAPSQRYTGIGAGNANAIVKTFDLTTIFLWSRNRQGSLGASYEAQKALISAGGAFDPKRLLITFELAGTSLDDAAAARSIILRDHLAGVMLWRNGAQQGGACSTDVNRKIAALLFGR